MIQINQKGVKKLVEAKNKLARHLNILLMNLRGWSKV